MATHSFFRREMAPRAGLESATLRLWPLRQSCNLTTMLTVKSRTLGASFIAIIAVSGIARAQRVEFDPRDLQGTWANDTATPLQRPAEFIGRDTFTPEEATKFEESFFDRLLNNLATDEDRALQIDYNDTYAEPKKVDRLRTSLIVDPANGRLPPAAPEAHRVPARSTDDPETLSISERCLEPGSGGLPYLPSGIISPGYQIVQTRDAVMIFTEAMHDARIIRLNGIHLPSAVKRWLGDSVGHWQGDTLVVDTTNFRPETRFQGSGERLHVVERFTRTGRDTIQYRFTVDDPDTWATAWTAEVVFRTLDVRLFESACHEGDHDRELMLRAARVQEQQQTGTASQR